jgi:hypothetical protein
MTESVYSVVKSPTPSSTPRTPEPAPAQESGADGTDARQYIPNEGAACCGICCGLTNMEIVRLLDDPSSSKAAWRLALLVRLPHCLAFRTRKPLANNCTHPLLLSNNRMPSS